MKKGAYILVLGLVLSAASFAGFYHLGTASGRSMLRQGQPELAWLKKEFHLGDAEYARICQMHEAYLPQCRERCQRIAEQGERLRDLLAVATNVTPEIQNLLVERAKTRAECEVAMLKQFLAVSRTMPPEQGKRYLEWVESQTCLRDHAIAQSRETEDSTPMPSGHHM